eukprot:m.106387 g.106387  ORF g.106387 m.106387 type:complete len:548 (-) comp15773_c0_seq1:74-1717(-)
MVLEGQCAVHVGAVIDGKGLARSLLASAARPGTHILRFSLEDGLPKVLVIWGTGLAGGSSLSVSVTLDGSAVSLGSVAAPINETAAALCLEPKWTAKQIKAAGAMGKAQRMAKLAVTTEPVAHADASNDKPSATSTTVAKPSPAGDKATLHGKRKLEESATQGKGTTSKSAKSADQAPSTGSAATTPELAPSTKGLEDSGVALSPRPVEKRGRYAKKREDSVARQKIDFAEVVGACPSARWGHSLSLLSDGSCFLFGGQGARGQLSKDPAWLLSADLQWTAVGNASGPSPATRMGHAACTNTEGNMVYVFGGAKNKRFFDDVHSFEKATNTWKIHKSKGGDAPFRSYHSMTERRGELIVWGGVHPNPHPHPDSCSDQLFIFNIEQENWYRPLVVGTPPCPRSGHSATLIDGNTLVIFGGWDSPTCFNDTYLLDLSTFEFSKLQPTGQAPSPRSWHVACVLPKHLGEQRLLVYGGYDGEDALSDAFVLDLKANSWHKVRTPLFPAPRAGLAGFVDPRTESVAFWGGGDNEGNFFQDLLQLRIDDLEVA